jgi:hypothetical protein
MTNKEELLMQDFQAWNGYNPVEPDFNELAQRIVELEKQFILLTAYVVETADSLKKLNAVFDSSEE